MFNVNITPLEIYEKREEFGLNNSISMLTEIIDTNKEDNTRSEAIRYLGKISNNSSTLKEQCFETLENILISDDGIEIKCSAAKALGKIKYLKALKPLKWIIEQESTDNKVKMASLEAIADIQIDEPELQLFIKELGNESQSIRDFIKENVINLKAEKLIESLLSSLKTGNYSEKHKIEIINLVGVKLLNTNTSFNNFSKFGNDFPTIFSNLVQNKDLLLENITNISFPDNSDLMENSLIILKTLGEEINHDLVKLLFIDNFIVKKNAIKLVGKLQLKEAVDFLFHNLDNMYSEVSIATIETLGEIGDLSAVPELLDVLNIEDISYEYLDLDLKFYILDAIRDIYLNNKNAPYDYLYSSLKTDNDMIKESIAYILGEIVNEEFMDPLVSLLEEKNLDVRKNSIIALGKIGNVKAIDPLINIIEDANSYWLLKKVAVDAIYNIYQKNWYLIKNGRTESKKLLNRHAADLIHHLSITTDENFKVKLSLIKFLEVFGGQPALSALLKRVNDFHRVVRIYSSNAIKKIEEQLEIENS